MGRQYGPAMRWAVHGEDVIYDSAWVRLTLVDVEVPGGVRFPHHVVRMPRKAAGAVVRDPQRGVLLLWRHRFITDTWGYEMPAGAIDIGESPEDAARRETLEETGWVPHTLRPLVDYHPTNGLSDQRFHLFLATGADHVAEPTDPSESERVEWLPVDSVRELIAAGEVRDGLSLTALLYALAYGLLDAGAR